MTIQCATCSNEIRLDNAFAGGVCRCVHCKGLMSLRHRPNRPTGKRPDAPPSRRPGRLSTSGGSNLALLRLAQERRNM